MDILPPPVQSKAPPVVASAKVRRRHKDRLIVTGLATACMAVYLRSLLPGIGYSGDTAKWQFLGEAGGVPHPTGYPLYLVVNRAFVSVVPWGSLAWRANLLSAVLGVVAILLLYRLLRLLHISPGVAAATALVCAFARTFWTQSVVAEVYTLHLALMAGVVVCLAKWHLGASNRWLLAGLAIYLLAFGNHMGTVLMLPGIAWIVYANRRRAVTLRNTLCVGAMALLSAAQYLYVIHQARSGRYVEYPVNDLRDIVTYVTGSYFKEQMVTFGPGDLLTTRLGLAAQLLWEEYFVLLPVIVLGLWLSLGPGSQRSSEQAARRHVTILLALWGLTAWLFALNYDVPNVIVYFLPPFFVLAVFLGIGLESLMTAVRQHARGRFPTRLVATATAFGLIALPVAAGLIDYRRASQRGAVADADRIEATLEAAGADAVLLTDGYLDSQYFWYYLLGEDMEATHNLALAHMVTTEDVLAHFTKGTGPVTAAASRVRNVEDPPLYTATRSQADDLRDAGFEVSPVAPEAWRVDGPTRPGP